MATVYASQHVAISDDFWLARIFGYDVFRVDLPLDAVAGEGGKSLIADDIREHSRHRLSAFYYAKIASTRVPIVRQLQNVGFSVADVNITLALDTQQPLPPSTSKAVGSCEISTIRSGEESAVLKIAESSFRYSRFHLDPDISQTTANAVKSEWLRSYLEGRRGDRLFVAHLDDQPVGFLAALFQENSDSAAAVVDLIGVTNTHRRRGIGEGLLRAFIDYYRLRCSTLQIGTQVANIPSLRMSQKCGFLATGSTYALHKHIL